MHPFKMLPGWLKYSCSHLIGKFLGRRFFWDLEALLKPKDAILSGCESEEEFMEQGKSDALLMEKMNLLYPDTVSLHIGCGIGRIEKFITPKVKEAYGIDISKVMIKKARRLVNEPNARFISTNGKDLKAFEDNTFSLIYSFFVFQHFSRAIALGYMHEVARTLKSNGGFLCQFQYKGENESIPDPPEEHPWGIRLYNVHDIHAIGEGPRLTVKEIYNLDEARALRSQGVEHGKCNVLALFQKPAYN